MCADRAPEVHHTSLAEVSVHSVKFKAVEDALSNHVEQNGRRETTRDKKTEKDAELRGADPATVFSSHFGNSFRGAQDSMDGGLA